VLVEPSLVAALVAEVSEQPGTLPLLEYALTSCITARWAHNDPGGLSRDRRSIGALTQQADALYDDLTKPNRQQPAKFSCAWSRSERGRKTCGGGRYARNCRRFLPTWS